MKTFLAATVSALALATAANATTFDPFVTATSYRDPGQPGLQTRVWKLENTGSLEFLGATRSFTLSALGDTSVVDLYRITHFDVPFDLDDLTASPATTTFDFGPLGTVNFMGTVNAQATGPAAPPTLPAVLSFPGAQKITVSATEALRITMGNTFFGPQSGQAGAQIVQATFQLVPVPLPAGLPLALLGLGALGALAARRKKAAAAA